MGLEYKGDHVRLFKGTFGKGSGYQIRYFNAEGKEQRKMVPVGEVPLEYAKEQDEKIGLQCAKSVGKVFYFPDVMELYEADMLVRLKNHRCNSEHGRKLSPGTFKKDMIHINKHITPFFEKMAIKKIKPSTILNFQDDTPKKLKP